MCRVQLRPSSPEPRLWGTVPPQSISIIERAVELEQAMTMRTTKSAVTFVQPFRLGAFGEQLPIGHYPTETDEELLDGMSLPAYQRPAAMMQLMLDPQRPSVTEIAMVDPQQLEEALTMDGMRPPMFNVDPAKVEP